MNARSHPWKRMLAVVMAAGILLIPWTARGQFIERRYGPTGEELRDLRTKMALLAGMVLELREASEKKGKPSPRRLADAEIFLVGARRCIRQGLFFSKGDVERARRCLEEGRARAASLQQGQAPWREKTGVIHFGQRSKVDDSLQPIMLIVPESYDFDGDKRFPLEVFLHGRAGTLSEINFLTSGGFDGAKETRDPPQFILYPYGRSNNGYHFAGEVDIFEALDEVKRRYRIDPNRITLRGFSMGGHGAWQVGLHYPGEWAAVSPGAGFVESRKYLRITDLLPAYEERLLHQYDAIDYVANGANVPFYSYVGDQDRVVSQHQLMAGAFAAAGVKYTEFIGPNTGHRYHPDVRKQILQSLAKHTRNPQPKQVRFVTYTLRYDRCHWVRLTGLEEHWKRAEIRAEVFSNNRLEIKTRNITGVALTPPMRHLVAGQPLELNIDGQPLRIQDWSTNEALHLRRADGAWSAGRFTGLRKRHGLQGPIDDALFGPVVVVAGSGTPWDDDLDAWTRKELQRFRVQWQQYFRARLPERTDRTITRADLRNKNLYLFGDPGSNSVLRRAMKTLPIEWEPGRFRLAGQQYSTSDHIPVMVYPNPLNPRRYIVINIGLTFSNADIRGSNARQRPHLPDYAVIKYQPGRFNDDRRKDTVLAGFFDERWRLQD